MAEERIETSSETEEERHARHEKERERLREKRRKNSMIVSFIMAFVMVIEIATVGIYMGFFSSGSSKRLAGYIETYSGEAYEVTLQRLEALAIKNGLPTSVYEDVITLDRVQITLEAFVNDLADRDFNSEIVTDDLNKAINENVRIHLTSTGVKIDENVNDNINSFS
ncbi:MAG: hypothetical protein IJS17_05820, partial [Clostridia bacterium]|nr:hypothetical protein [Clostridia bacterium]